ncbi:transposable element Tcb1 transposase [Trichonephila clavipes]|nr:transposable element Tcb1 transposase [Trichonephila clavipes]
MEARQLVRFDCVVRRHCYQWIRGTSFTRIPVSGRPRQTSRREDHHIVRNARVQPTAYRPSSKHSDESRFNLRSDDNCVRVGRPRGERLNPASALQRHTAPIADVMVSGTIAYNTRLPLVLIRGTMIAKRNVHDILQPQVLPLIQRLAGAIFHQDNARPHTARVSQDGLRTFTTLPWPARSLDLSPIKLIWDHLGWRVGHPTSLNELEARLQQIRNENVSRHHTELVCLNALIASCIRTRGGSTGY